VHSVDSKKILDEFKKREQLLRGPLRFFIQVNTSGEEQKSGVVSYDDCLELYNHYQELSFEKISFAGLMTIGKIRTENFEQDAKRSFAQLVGYQKKLLSSTQKCQLSMGMSADYQWALEAGSDWVRIGSALFR
jgi:uncharacterized pyridoxal phosphate-containing UPF0001 family protein